MRDIVERLRLLVPSDSTGASIEAANEITRLRAQNAELVEALERIREWADAYPTAVFAEPDWKRAATVLSAAGMSLGSISAANMKHAISGVGNIARAALAKVEKETSE